MCIYMCVCMRGTTMKMTDAANDGNDAIALRNVSRNEFPEKNVLF